MGIPVVTLKINIIIYNKGLSYLRGLASLLHQLLKCYYLQVKYKDRNLQKKISSGQ